MGGGEKKGGRAQQAPRHQQGADGQDHRAGRGHVNVSGWLPICRRCSHRVILAEQEKIKKGRCLLII